jgi:hypothetical protein
MIRKAIITTILMSATASLTFGQDTLNQSASPLPVETPNLRSNAHIGFVYPLSTNGVRAAEYTNLFSAHAIAGVSRVEEAFCVSGVATVITDSAKGFVGSGVVNVIGGNMLGFQSAGSINYTGGRVRGAQTAGFLNYARNVEGFQGAGFANVVRRNVNGVQAAGFINVADTVTTQLAGYVNVSHNARTQIAGFVNVAKDVKGAQIAGFVNVAKKVKGVQIAGFINIADSSDCPIGLINIIKNGEQAIGLTMNETGTSLVTFRSGGRKLYGILGIGGNFVEGYSAFAIQAGLGMHTSITRTFRFNTEVSVSSLSDRWGHTDIRSGVKVMPSLRFGAVELFGGPSFSYTATGDLQGLGRVGYSVWSRDSYGYSHDLSVGLEGGIQFHLNGTKRTPKIISEKNQE